MNSLVVSPPRKKYALPWPQTGPDPRTLASPATTLAPWATASHRDHLMSFLSNHRSTEKVIGKVGPVTTGAITHWGEIQGIDGCFATHLQEM